MGKPELDAVIFDVDGTLGETERHGHRVAFNRAFEQLGLEDRWDEELYGKLLKVTGGVRRLKHYFVDYAGRPEAESAELAAKLHPIKTDLFLEVVKEDRVPPRPGVLRFLKELAGDGLRLAVATTGTRAWVLPLLEKLCVRGALEPFEAVVTGDDVAERKPDPEAFHLAFERLGLDASDTVIVEDSRNGVMAATATKAVCLAVQGEYADPADLQEAALLVDSFGTAQQPLKVLHNPHQINVGPMLTPTTVRALHSKAAVKC